jgi:hypothetical protein
MVNPNLNTLNTSLLIDKDKTTINYYFAELFKEDLGKDYKNVSVQHTINYVANTAVIEAVIIAKKKDILLDGINFLDGTKFLV